MPRRGNRQRGVVELVRAGERRRRQVEQAVLVLVDQPAVLGVAVEILAGDQRRDAEPRRRAHEHGAALVALAAEHRLGCRA